MSDEPVEPFIAYCLAEFERLRNLTQPAPPIPPRWDGPPIVGMNPLATQQPKGDPG
jgi:hypothetical protein